MGQGCRPGFPLKPPRATPAPVVARRGPGLLQLLSAFWYSKHLATTVAGTEGDRPVPSATTACGCRQTIGSKGG